ncbi:hypothetical protein [Paenibacillus polymyxa]|uniref:hypothetical protein n=1 Tax=Paenibacillus polymyxa TaxID=1406 RepID=UPI002024860E|nr:hypothetical protein [Paenibacillus polymyxa]URJ58897.3 hypothetical protein MF622_003487 [Paenibacillus polymyxa]
MSFSKIYDYKLRAYFNERISDLNHEYLFYSYPDQEQNLRVLTLNINEQDHISLVRWHDLFDRSLFTKMDHPILSVTDAELLIRLLSLMFNVFDIHKDAVYSRKNLCCVYYQYQVSHLAERGNEFTFAQDRLFFLHLLLFELGLGDDIYDRLTIENNKILYSMEDGQQYDLHILIDMLHEHINKNEMDKDTRAALGKIKILQSQLVDFILGSHDVYDFPFDDFNNPFAEATMFIQAYNSNKNRVLEVLIDCINEHQSPTEQLISHLILMNYSYFVLKSNPSEITYFKSFCKKKPGVFMKVLSSLLEIRFLVDKSSFTNEGINYYLSRIKGG